MMRFVMVAMFLMVTCVGSFTAVYAETAVASVRSVESASVGLIDLNTAGVKELQTLTGVGKVMAQRIIDFRLQNGAFVKVEDVKKVKGIGKVTFEQIAPFVTIGASVVD